MILEQLLIYEYENHILQKHKKTSGWHVCSNPQRSELCAAHLTLAEGSRIFLKLHCPPMRKINEVDNRSICSKAGSHTWLASSRVGDMISARKPLFVGCFSCIKIGMLKANVFPDPVGADARSSRPYKHIV